MSAQIQYRCDFCSKNIITNSINFDHTGFCLTKDKKEFTNDLRCNIDGPHICMSCVALTEDARRKV
jgi:hypothetical protein